jgi:hypothetical protein
MLGKEATTILYMKINCWNKEFHREQGHHAYEEFLLRNYPRESANAAVSTPITIGFSWSPQLRDYWAVYNGALEGMKIV